MPPKQDLTIVMYHYVRPLELTRYPKIKGLRLSEFRNQLNYIRSYYQPVTVKEVTEYFRNQAPLPPNAALLTFDDGYLDHYTYVFPILHDLGIQGAFFPPVLSSGRGKILDVNKIHFILASIEDEQLIVEELNRSVADYDGVEAIESYWTTYAKPGRFDTAGIVYIKYMLQTVLPERIRSEISDRLFRKFVTSDPSSFAHELYANTAQLKTMQKCGMYIGSHGVSHRWMDSLPEEEQRQEIEESLKFLREIESPVDDYWVMSYPSGVSNDGLRSLLKNYDCSLAFTTEVGRADLSTADPFLLPRLDTNDLPKL